MKEFVTVDGKELRLGYTTGSCAAAASKAAATMILTGRRLEGIKLLTPKGIELELNVEDITIEYDDSTGEPVLVRCAIRKDSGDDPDVTNGALVYSEVTLTDLKGEVDIDGGYGVGRVTKPGLDQPVGNAAINSVPRKMITENLQEVARELSFSGGFKVVISIPLGQELARKTFNPRLGIEGGISVIGTTGIVEPMSERALIDTIKVELTQKKELGYEYVLLTPGNYGSDFIRDGIGIDPEMAVQTSNFIGDSIDMCVQLGFKGALLIGHIGKLVKIAGNMLNTHSKYGDCRMEILSSAAAVYGVKPETARYILGCAACDEAVRVMKEEGIDEAALQLVSDRIEHNLDNRAFKACAIGQSFEVGAIMFSKEYGKLGETAKAQELLGKIVG
ncbi:MAG: cobalt-precorrin-5B (C(1))-methyltransferase CbiD [Clostridiales bacterium]|nr:cobalt-precorrin-5B (C(1))-methyltransferase CbiD [Clostridiales bacterium]